MLLKKIFENVHEVCRAGHGWRFIHKDIIQGNGEGQRRRATEEPGEGNHGASPRPMGSNFFLSHHFHSSPPEPFPSLTPGGSLFVSRLRGRAVRRASHDSLSLGRFRFWGRFSCNAAVPAAVARASRPRSGEQDALRTDGETPALLLPGGILRLHLSCNLRYR